MAAPAPAAGFATPLTTRLRRRRLALALAIGAVSALFCYLFQRLGPQPDFLYWWSAARMVLAGQDPYALMATYGNGPPPFDTPFGYPLPAALFVVPLAGVPVQLASSIAFGGVSALLAYVVIGTTPHRLPLFVGGSFIVAGCTAQWSPLIVTAGLAPALAFVLWAKPTIGLAVLAYRWSWRGVLLAAAVGVASLVVLPTWPVEWVRTASRTVSHPAPIATRFGPLLLLALLRWRNREARVLLVMACVPQLLFFYDQLPLWLIPRTARQSLWLSAASAAGLAGWAITVPKGDVVALAAAPWVIALVYFPSLLIVLLQPHDGAVPAWLRRLLPRPAAAPTPTPPA